MNTTHSGANLLPELSEDRIEVIENRVFETIDRERSSDKAKATKNRSRRFATWLVAGAAAAIVVVAAVIAPSINSGMATSSAPDIAVAPAEGEPGLGAVDLDGAALEGATSGGQAADFASSPSDAREIIASASATVEASNVAEAIAKITAAADARGGYVESQDVGTSGAMPSDQMMPVEPYLPSSGGWISVRVPSAELPEMITELAEVGRVVSSSTSATDVTSQAVDLRARLTAAEASVERLLDLMSQAATTADLLAAESALAERQATVESYTQQLTMLEDQVAMSSLSVSVVTPNQVVNADPAGFGDGLAAGWNGLIATLNGIVIALGFMLPWLAVIGVAGLIVWAIVRARRNRRAARAAAASEKD